MSRDAGGANFYGAVPQARLKSSFIYLANAVNDLTGDWYMIGAVLAPLVVVGALCLLPDAINLQHFLQSFGGAGGAGAQNVAWLAQEPYRPGGAPEIRPVFSWWLVVALQYLFFLIAALVGLVVLSLVAQLQAPERPASTLDRFLDVYRRALHLCRGYLLVIFLQSLLPEAFAGFLAGLGLPIIGGLVYLVIGLPIYLMLYFARFALVLDRERAVYSMMHSRDLMRRRFFKVATRIVVFLAVATGYNAWAGLVFLVFSRVMGLIGAFAGVLWAGIFIADLIWISVLFATIAFFIAASVRLYTDVKAIERERMDLAMPPAAPLAAPRS